MEKTNNTVSEHGKRDKVLRSGPQIMNRDIEIPASIIENWQSIVESMAEIIGVPSALIMRVDQPFIRVFSSNRSPANPYIEGEAERLTGLYCEEVIRSRNKLLVPNALKDRKWDKNPDIKLGMISYLGFPIFWPDGKVFGTICILDSKENSYSDKIESLMSRFKDLIEAHLALLRKDLVERRNLEEILDSLSEGIIAHDNERRILFFNRAAEEITGYRREEILHRDCHEAFGEPFCGGRCSFENGPPEALNHISYPLNIRTKEGEFRRVEMSVNNRNDETGGLVGVIASFRDVTDRVGLQIQLGKLQGFGEIIGRDPKMLQIYGQIRELATNDYPVHISGETGTGKELVANAIHTESRRGGGPFVPVNCGALPEGLLESELFGHVKGAFTGAIRDKKGRFELAHKGTLFLDEVADLPKSVQSKLLRVLQEGSFERVGGEETISVDVRLISATNRDLKVEMKNGNFREDLYYRINVVPINLPSLRDRKDDIPLFLENFLLKAKEEGQDTPGLSREALDTMKEYRWPGNVRELQSALRFALVRARGEIIQVDHLPSEIRELTEGLTSRGPARKLDKEVVSAALIQSGGNKAKAARLLGVGRATLYRFLADFPDIS
ncbi:MAG: sigma 54-interacting transcriptional regulator [Desulfatiglans sp.]|jgi:PAS domain S-box-containing protein|nr:sigma 54-interacting transcriptional regulator [Thermodesulfobacteriota bacterium]MEE4354725.1 sigma 54-interacting transcriptional regulator [Desulfatiglans sp.]